MACGHCTIFGCLHKPTRITQWLRSTCGGPTGDDVANQFLHAMRLMRSRDPQKQEDGFHLLRPHAAQHLEELITEFNREPNHGLRCWMLALIGEARSAEALPVLVAQLHGDDESLRDWAVRGLEQLDTKPARHQLYQARSAGLIR